MRNNRTILLAAALVFVTANCGVAATIDVDTVIGPDYPFQQETIVVVDGLNPPTDVTILDGVLLGTPSGPTADVGIDLRGVSRAKMLGGILQGNIESVSVHDSSLFHMVEGEIIFRPVVAHDNGRVILDSGLWGDAFAYDNSRVYINGGDDDWIF
jgi:hypothetical protein